jgi:2-polyprenyl-3-methyl-5-hydroxy-6-metoxy-1,4-benzoquinol methylase
MENFKKCKICGSEIKLLNEKYNLGQCLNCKFIFCLNYFTQDEFIKVYDNLYNIGNSHYQKHSKDEFGKLITNKAIKVGLYRARMIKKNIFKPEFKSVLEIGSGVGLVGAYIRAKSPNISYTGIELDKEAYGKSKLLKLNTIHGDFTEMSNLNKKFDVIMLWEVLEHLQDLNTFLELAYEKLSVNGRIILSTPNYNKIYNYPKRTKDQIFQDTPPVHLNFFTPENIKNIFELKKFKECDINVKKMPYLQLSDFNFYLNTVRALLGKYKGTSIYFSASKK